MINIVPDIPRLYTAIAEWLACIIYIMTLKRRFDGWKLIALSGSALLVQAVFLTMTGNLPLVFWIPCMGAAVALMYLFIYLSCDITIVEAGYTCIRAFVAAEFVASLEWQLHCYFWPQGKDSNMFLKVLLLVIIYGVIFFLIWLIEKRHVPENGKLDIRQRNLWSAMIIGLTIFGISNLSFVSIRTPFSGKYTQEIFNIRTMVNLGGVAILFAHHMQCCELRIRHELEAIQNVLKNQYSQYQQSKESIEIINYKYHDLKHQIAILRNEEDLEKRNAYLAEMENEIKAYEAQNKTGNKVLDTVLNAKKLYCIKNKITLTCVADGTLLNEMDVMDICTIFGNALDNAIECEKQIKDEEKRLIHVSVSAQKGFLMIRFENYYEGELKYEESLPITTKKDTRYHGYGLKSIRYAAQKYGGAVSISHQKNWFELQILMPLLAESNELLQ